MYISIHVYSYITVKAHNILGTKIAFTNSMQFTDFLERILLLRCGLF